MGNTEDRGVLDADCIQDSQHIVNVLLKRRQPNHSVREPSPTLVEHDKPGKRREPFQEARILRLFPLRLQVAVEPAE